MGRRRKSEKDLECAQCLKYLMFGINVFFFMLGATIFGLGVWILTERNFMSALFGTDLMTAAAWLTILGGAIVMVISIFGIIGAILENQPMLMVYFFVLSGIFLALVIGGVLAIVFRTELKEGIVIPKMRESLRDYYGVDLEYEYNRAVTQAWDDAQTFLRCCAVEDQSWGLYRGSNWYKEQPGVPEKDKAMVPESCCMQDQYKNYIDLDKCQNWVLGPPLMTGGQSNEALHYRGCYTAGVDFVYEFSAYLIGMSITVAGLLIGGIVTSIMLWRWAY